MRYLPLNWHILLKCARKYAWINQVSEQSWYNKVLISVICVEMFVYMHICIAIYQLLCIHLFTYTYVCMLIEMGALYICSHIPIRITVVLSTCVYKNINIKLTTINNIFNFEQWDYFWEKMLKTFARRCFLYIAVIWVNRWHINVFSKRD